MAAAADVAAADILPMEWDTIERIIERHIAHIEEERDGRGIENKTTKSRQQSCRVAAHIKFNAVLRNIVICAARPSGKKSD